MGYESLTEFSINQSIIIHFIAHKCMPKNFLDYLGNKVTFLKWADNGLLLAKFIEFFCRVLIRHYCNKFIKLIARYSNDSKDHKGYKPKRILPFASVKLSPQKSQLQWWLPRLAQLSNCLTSRQGTDEARMNRVFSLNFFLQNDLFEMLDRILNMPMNTALQYLLNNYW